MVSIFFQANYFRIEEAGGAFSGLGTRFIPRHAPASMGAAPLLRSVVRALREQRLEVVFIGNAAAALHGAPVTTLDFDFMFRVKPANLAKLKRVAKSLPSVIDMLEATLREKEQLS